MESLGSLKLLLKPEFEVVAMADNALSLIDTVAEQSPEPVVVDQSLGGQSFLRHRRIRHSDVALIVIGDEDSDSVVIREILAPGAAGYAHERLSATDLIPAAQAAIQGEKNV